MQEPSGKRKRSFWTTTPVILGGIAGVIGAVATLIIALGDVGILEEGDDSASPTPSVTVTQPPLPPFAFEAVADATVNIDRPSENLGTETTLKVDGNPMRITFVRFNVEGLTQPVTLAQLWFLCVSALKGGAPEGGSVWTISGSWTETGITWENKPLLETKVVGVTTAVPCPDDNVVMYDVTRAVERDGTYNFALSTESGDGLTFYSRENSPGRVSSPLLVVNPPPESQ